MTYDLEPALEQAVAAIGGQLRPGQQEMVKAIGENLDAGVHLIVQAGTGTGKSLGYLIPVVARVTQKNERVVIATATLALQAQLANKDIPNAIEAVATLTGKRPNFALLKGHSNYACLLRARSDDLSQEQLFYDQYNDEVSDTESELSQEVRQLRNWIADQAEQKGLADRDDAPTHTARGWNQVAITSRECVGVGECPFGLECFVERARSQARNAQIIVTNHALLAVNAMHEATTLPEYDVVVIDEAHELVSRVTGAATDYITTGGIERIIKRSLPWINDDITQELFDNCETLADTLAKTDPGRIIDPNCQLIKVLSSICDNVRAVISELKGESDLAANQVSAALQEVFEITSRMSGLKPEDVVWVSKSDIAGTQLYVAPLEVADLMRKKIFCDHNAILTSATLSLGGSFYPIASALGLYPEDEIKDDSQDITSCSWRAIDVGSPFDYSKQGILYVAKDLAPPSKDGIDQVSLARIAELIWASNGRALGLFASRKSAEAAASYVKQELPNVTIFCQGEAQLAELVNRFVVEPNSCLFGTISLWQGVDIPGETCQLVIIDKIPFPRPDDPLMQARQLRVSQNGGNGFMAVAASQAALLLAQGAGRLIRTVEDRGVVALLDPRLIKARYGSFLRRSMPDFWFTTDLQTVITSLQRLVKQRKKSS